MLGKGVQEVASSNHVTQTTKAPEISFPELLHFNVTPYDTTHIVCSATCGLGNTRPSHGVYVAIPIGAEWPNVKQR
jgi:hypothetical protein